MHPRTSPGGRAAALGRRSLAGAAWLTLIAAAACGGARADPGETTRSAGDAAGPGSPARHAQQADEAGHGPHPTERGVGELSDHSVYHLGAQWWDQHGEARALESLAGRPQVVAMAYTHCAQACPRILMDMKRMEAELARDSGGAGFVLISIDPERDTSDRLRYFAEATRLDPQRWTLLGGSDHDVRALATLLGIRYRRDGETDFSHSNTMLVLNSAGEIVFRQLGLGEDLGPMIAAIRAELPAASLSSNR